MEIKKTPKSNVKNYGKLLMQLGLVLALFISAAAIDKETFDNQFNDLGNETLTPITTEKIPTFPGCDENDKECFNKKIQQHLASNLNISLLKKLGLKPGKKQITMLFKIDKEGNIADVSAKAPSEKLKKEIIRVIKKLPKMLPGEQDGKPVGVKYTLPMQINIKK